MNNYYKNKKIFVPREWQKVSPLVLRVLLEVKIDYFVKVFNSVEGVFAEFEEIIAFLTFDGDRLYFKRWSDFNNQLDRSSYYAINLDIIDTNKYFQQNKTKKASSRRSLALSGFRYVSLNIVIDL
ncbi:hypothetical protein [Bracoviriform nigricipitis]|uniref:Uncharacterized protein TnBV1 n=1 Tax=Bracoviriform nigricipitis TaxID=2169782 RepID=Q9WIE0_9VIRU|nr:hypothetical protein KM452_s2gp1 [Bracoviriform nigricipitis]CAB43525.1 hypothetical protein [Bracoviriform nigricipitis]